MERLLLFSIAIGLSALVGLLGKSRKIGFGWSFVLSLFLTPFIGLLITIFSSKKDVQFVDADKNN